MKKVWLVGVVIGIVVIALGVTGFVYAQVQAPPAPDYPGRPSGGRSSRGHGMMGGYQWNSSRLHARRSRKCFWLDRGRTTRKIQCW